jgi:hypothetical protein
MYYGAWDPRHWKDSPPRGGVGIALLPRDRFADLVVEEAGKGPGDYQVPTITSEFLTAPISITGKTAPQFYLNADGLGSEAVLRIELLRENEQPIPGYSGKDAALVSQSGFQTPIAWNGIRNAADLPARIRIHVSFEGKRNTDIRFSALYIRPESFRSSPGARLNAFGQN